MDVNQIKDGPLKDIFDALEEAFEKYDIDFYLIGAQARDQWFSKENLVARRTNDVDFAVYISDRVDYEVVRLYLQENFAFTETKQNQFVMLTPGGVQVDILPFGNLEIDDAVHFEGEGLSRLNVNGFKEIYLNGTELFATDTGHEFKVASLPSIVLLKLIAFDDRPEKRRKDAIDINNILEHYFQLQSELIYHSHNDIFGDTEIQDPGTGLPEISAIVIGREIKKIIQDNQMLYDRVKRVLATHIEQGPSSIFIRAMMASHEETVASKLKLLQYLLRGLNP